MCALLQVRYVNIQGPLWRRRSLIAPTEMSLQPGFTKGMTGYNVFFLQKIRTYHAGS